jgi:hypothetical protein
MMRKDFSMEFNIVFEDLGEVKRKVEKENWQESMNKMRSEINVDLKKVEGSWARLKIVCSTKIGERWRMKKIARNWKRK